MFPQTNNPASLKQLVVQYQFAVRANDSNRAAELARPMFGNELRLSKVFVDDVPAQALAQVCDLHKRLRGLSDEQVMKVLHISPQCTEAHVYGATTEQLAAGAEHLGKFPPQARYLSQRFLRPGVVFYEIELVMPGAETGDKLHLFYWTGDRWVMLGPIWKLPALCPNEEETETSESLTLAERQFEFEPDSVDYEAQLAKIRTASRELKSRTRILLFDQVAAEEKIRGEAAEESEKERKRLLADQEAKFSSRYTEIQAQKEALEKQARDLQQQLLEFQKQAEASKEEAARAPARAKAAPKPKRLSIDDQLRRLMSQDDADEELRGAVSKMLDQERDRIASGAQAKQAQQMAMLQKKLQRLASQLDGNEKELKRHKSRAAAMAASGGMVGIMDAGIDEDDPDKEKKLSLLKAVFDDNKAMREHIEKAGIRIEHRRRPKRSADTEPQAKPEPAEVAVRTAPETAREVEPEPVAAAVVAEGDADVAEDAYDDLLDPDNEVWEPGESFNSNVRGDHEAGEDGDSPVKKITAASAQAFEPPPLEIARGKKK